MITWRDDLQIFVMFVVVVATGVLSLSHVNQAVCDDDMPPKPSIILPIVPVLIEPEDPPEPKPSPAIVPVDKLAADAWYVIESAVPLIVLHSPDGLVGVEEDAGPVRVRGVFADGTGATESRLYSAPHVYLVTAKKAGKTELVVVPVGVSTAADIVRQTLTVMGQGPQPPPGPGPTPEPEPDPVPKPEPVKSFRVIFVVESGDTLPAKQSAIAGAKSILDYLDKKTTKDDGRPGWREFDPDQTTANEPEVFQRLWESIKLKSWDTPCLAIEVNGKVDVLPYPSDTPSALATLKKYGGDGG